MISESFSLQRDVISIILGGGAGTRLFPLTKDRAKPAVPLAGKYRLVDIPISNCINSDLKRIFVLTQFQSSSLHRHIHQSYHFDDFSNGFIEIMAAQQTSENMEWYQGTADAVRHNMLHLQNHSHELALILCGDQLYRMDYRDLLEQHLSTRAEVTVATIPVRRDVTSQYGIMEIDDERQIQRFVEKPKDAKVLDSLKLQSPMLSTLRIHSDDDLYLASMGIYVFNRRSLEQGLALKNRSLDDFGKHIIPEMIHSHRVFAYVHHGYWEDIGTIKAFFESNLDLTGEQPMFNFFDVSAPIYSRPRYLPASRLLRCTLDRTLIADGCVIDDAIISHSVVGIRSWIDIGTVMKDCIIMGHDYYETPRLMMQAEAKGQPRMGIGQRCHLERVIVDKNTRIGNNVRITPEGKADNMDGPNFYVRDGIVVIPKNAIVPDGTII
jgi:glucose-1-phosphate adenylyltransferase